MVSISVGINRNEARIRDATHRRRLRRLSIVNVQSDRELIL